MRFFSFLGGLFGSKKGPGTTGIDFRLLTEQAADVILQIDSLGVATYVSPSCTKILGWNPDEMIGKGPDAFVCEEDLPQLAAAHQQKLSGDDSSSSEVIRVRHKNGNYVWMEGHARAVHDSTTGRFDRLVLSLRDVTERKIMEEQLSFLAMTDGLTGLANRRAFDRAIESEWRRTLREGCEMSLILIDVDHFKSLNDRFGHQVGDDCLRAIASTVKDFEKGESDLAARYGGEELVLILPGANLDDAAEIGEKLRDAIQDLKIPNPENLEGGGYVSVSVGVATAFCRIGGSVKMPESLLTAADSALYRAKHEGRNRIATAMVLTPGECSGGMAA